ncbi:MAG: diguanylate cyclase [Paracoccaceae bacterium]
MSADFEQIDEAARIRAVRRSRLLEATTPDAFDRIVRVASEVYGTPIALITLVDTDRQIFLAKRGTEAAETPRSIAFCHHTIQEPVALVVPDATADIRFAANPLVVGEMGIRAYMGVPICSPDGYRLGSLCVIDTRPRPDIAARGAEVLADLGQLVTSDIEMRLLSQTDALTGVASRRWFLEMVARECTRSARSGQPVTLGVLDIDRFKAVNDRHGHPVGDEVLSALAGRLQACMRKKDMLGRLGGEEFGLLLGDTDTAAGYLAADRVRRVTSDQVFHTSAGSLPLTISLGLATRQGETTDPEELLRAADAALYEAKREGRNCVRYASDPAAGLRSSAA